MRKLRKDERFSFDTYGKAKIRRFKKARKEKKHNYLERIKKELIDQLLPQEAGVKSGL